MSDARQANGAAGPYGLDAIGNHLAHPCAFNDGIRHDADVLDRSGMIGRAEGLDQVRFSAGLHSVKDMDLEPERFGGERRQQPDRTGTRHQQNPRVPERPPPNEHNLFQGFCDDGGRLQQHTEQAQARVQLNGVFGFDAPAFRHESVNLLDAALGVLAVAAHIPFTHRASGTGERVRATDDSHDQVALPKRTAKARVNDAA